MLASMRTTSSAGDKDVLVSCTEIPQPFPRGRPMQVRHVGI